MTRAGAAKAAHADPSEEAATPDEASPQDVAKAVKVFTKELKPLAIKVKKAVRQAVVRAGDDVLNDTSVKDTMKKVVKQAVKEAVKVAVQEAQAAMPAGSAA